MALVEKPAKNLFEINHFSYELRISPKKMNISVCMATFNGEDYIKEQILSILEQLADEDEIIIVDDCSKDNTLQIIKYLNDNRINIYINERNRGHVFSFARAIALAKNDIIFLSDQDDVWVEGRVKLMKETLLISGAIVVSSNFDILNVNGKIEKFSNSSLRINDSTRYISNIWGIFLGKRAYYGCAMAFRKELTDLILPIPFFIQSHDLFIAIASNLLASNIHIENTTHIRRLHNNNATNTNRKLLPKLWSRVIYVISILVLLYRITKNSINKKL